MFVHAVRLYFFFFNDTATTEIYTLSLHDALPISSSSRHSASLAFSISSNNKKLILSFSVWYCSRKRVTRSEEHTSELQSRPHLVCRLLLEKKNRGPPRDRIASADDPAHRTASGRC